MRLLIAAAFAFAALTPAQAEDGLIINVPIVLKEAKVVFNMDHLAFEGDTPFGLDYMRILAEGFTADKTNWQIVSIFHGAAGYMLLTAPDIMRSAITRPATSIRGLSPPCKRPASVSRSAARGQS